MSTIWLTIARGLLVLTLLSVLNCCAYPKKHSRPKLQELQVPVAVPKPEPRFYVHRVRWKGETLFSIAKWYTGSGKNWKALSNAKPKLHPNRIVINDNILIPEDLMKSRKPMPLSFLPSSIRKKGVQSSPPKQSSTEFDAVELFGPIVNEQPSIESGVVELFGPIVNEQALIDSHAIELFKPTE